MKGTFSARSAIYQSGLLCVSCLLQDKSSGEASTLLEYIRIILHHNVIVTYSHNSCEKTHISMTDISKTIYVSENYCSQVSFDENCLATVVLSQRAEGPMSLTIQCSATIKSP